MSTTSGIHLEQNPALRFRKGGLAVLIPPLEADADADLAVTIDCIRGGRPAGRLPRKEGGGSSAAYILLNGTFPLNGFKVLVDGEEIFEHPRTESLLFDEKGRIAGPGEGRRILVRFPDGKPVPGNVVSKTEWEGLEVIEFDAGPSRHFEISKPSLRFRDGSSYLYVARYIGGRDDPFEVTLSGDFGSIVLGRMMHRRLEDSAISNGTEFRLSDYGITVLDEFDLFIDGRKVFSNPARDHLVFTFKGTITKYPRGEVNAVFLEDVDVDCEGTLVSETGLPCGLIWRKYSSDDHMTFSSRVLEEGETARVRDRETETLDEVPSEEPPTFEESYGIEDYDAPNDPHPELCSGQFLNAMPRMILKTTGAVRRFCIAVPPYRPYEGIEPKVTFQQNGRTIDAGTLPVKTWMTEPCEIDLISNGVDPLGTHKMFVDGQEVFSSKGINILFFTKDGTCIVKARGRVILAHRPGLNLGVRGPTKARIICKETQGDWVFEEAELGVRGKLYNIDVEPEMKSWY